VFSSSLQPLNVRPPRRVEIPGTNIPVTRVTSQKNGDLNFISFYHQYIQNTAQTDGFKYELMSEKGILSV
jgi:hypothetical protein